MPFSNVLANAGPSNIRSSSVATRKRAISNASLDGREHKKNKGDDNERREAKDKKKRRKRKKKMPVVVDPREGTKTPARDVPASTGRGSLTPTESIPDGLGEVAQPVKVEDGSPATVSGETENNAGVADSQTQHTSSVTSDGKGKGRATASSSASDTISSESPEDKIAHLTSELDSRNKLLEKHESTISQLQQSITCQICLDLMYKPYALAPCGHLSCYNCLVSWFTAPNPDGQPAQGAQWRRKTCPHCRAVIRERPVEVWGVKSIVGTLARSSLLTGVVEHPEDTAPAPAPADPWQGIFRKVPTMNIFDAPGADAARGPELGMYDAEDGGIYRCLDCMHEIWGGVCTGCHRAYPGHAAQEGWPLDMDGDEDDDEDDDGSVNYGDIAMWFRQALPPAPMLPLGHFRPRIFQPHSEDEDEGSDEEGEEEEEGYESSFVDDGDVYVHRPEVIELSDAETEGRVRVARRPQAIVLSDNEDDGDYVPPPRAAAALRRGPRGGVVIDSDDEVAVVEPPVRRRGFFMPGGRTVDVRRDADMQLDEEEDEEDEDEDESHEDEDEEQDDDALHHYYEEIEDASRFGSGRGNDEDDEGSEYGYNVAY